MATTRTLIDHHALEKLAAAHLAQATIVADEDGGWGVVVRYGRTEAVLAATRGRPRMFAKLDTAAGYLRGLGLMAFNIDAQAFDPKSGASLRAPRPDRASALKRAHAAAAHETWFLDEVKASLADPRPSIDDTEVRRTFAARRDALKKRVTAAH